MIDRCMTMTMALTLACVSACAANDEPLEPEGYEQIESEELLDYVDEVVAVQEDARDERVDAPRPDALVDPEGPQQAPGDPCSIVDSNGPLPGGTITVNGCDEGEFCFAFACGGYSCFGTCTSGGGFGGF